MKNVTLAMEEETLARLRVYAAERKTTVNAIFRNYAKDLVGDSERREEARKRLLELSRKSAEYDETHPVGADDRAPAFSRDQTYSGRRFQWPREDS